VKQRVSAGGVCLVVNWFEELKERVGKLKAQIPWLRVFVEGVVIAAFLRPEPQSSPPIR